MDAHACKAHAHAVQAVYEEKQHDAELAKTFSQIQQHTGKMPQPPAAKLPAPPPAPTPATQPPAPNPPSPSPALKAEAPAPAPVSKVEAPAVTDSASSGSAPEGITAKPQPGAGTHAEAIAAPTVTPPGDAAAPAKQEAHNGHAAPATAATAAAPTVAPTPMPAAASDAQQAVPDTAVAAPAAAPAAAAAAGAKQGAAVPTGLNAEAVLAAVAGAGQQEAGNARPQVRQGSGVACLFSSLFARLLRVLLMVSAWGCCLSVMLRHGAVLFFSSLLHGVPARIHRCTQETWAIQLRCAGLPCAAGTMPNRACNSRHASAPLPNGSLYLQ